MRHCTIDHLAVTAPSLAVGAAYVRDLLGVAPQAGGEHPRMGTHNLLLRLGEDLFLEVIAPNPAAPPPLRPRWFGLDALAPGTPPALSVWVARTADIQAAADACPESLGIIEPMQRGALTWRITIPADGSLPMEGIAPVLIEWQAEPHPAANLQDHGLSLARLVLHHPEPERVARLLEPLGLASQVVVAAPQAGTRPALVAHINTPQGPRVLASARESYARS